MLSTRRLLGMGGDAARRQAWAFLPLYIATVLGRLLGLLPAIVLFARFVRHGIQRGAPDLGLAFVMGLFSEKDPKAVGLIAIGGALIVSAAGWLLTGVLSAGALRQLATQTGRAEHVSDDAFAEGVLSSPVSYLLAGAGAEALKIFSALCGMGALIAAMVFFIKQPGAPAAFFMTTALGMVIMLPAMVASLEIGFARSVILDEGPISALGEGMLLSLRRISDYLPAWYILITLEMLLTFAVALARIGVGNLPNQGDLWILNIGPSVGVWLMGIAAGVGVQFWRLGVAATLVAESAGSLPEPPPPPPPHLEPIFIAREVPPDVVYEARAIMPPDDPLGST